MSKTTDALHRAYTGESKAALRLKVFAEKAQQEGYGQIARLFRAVAASEEVHGARALKVLKEIKSTEQNLAESFEKEERVAGVAYSAFIKEAEAEGNKAAALHFSQSRDVEEIHAKLYKRALANLLEERVSVYYICRVCGYVEDGSLPDTCPICQAPSSQFMNVD